MSPRASAVAGAGRRTEGTPHAAARLRSRSAARRRRRPRLRRNDAPRRLPRRCRASRSSRWPARSGRGWRVGASRQVPHTYHDWEDLVARDDLDVVSIGMPNHLHHPIAVAALSAASTCSARNPWPHRRPGRGDGGRGPGGEPGARDRVQPPAPCGRAVPPPVPGRAPLGRSTTRAPLGTPAHRDPRARLLVHNRQMAGGGAMIDLGSARARHRPVPAGRAAGDRASAPSPTANSAAPAAAVARHDRKTGGHRARSRSRISPARCSAWTRRSLQLDARGPATPTTRRTSRSTCSATRRGPAVRRELRHRGHRHASTRTSTDRSDQPARTSRRRAAATVSSWCRGSSTPSDPGSGQTPRGVRPAPQPGDRRRLPVRREHEEVEVR